LSIAENIKAKREAMHLTQQELADRVYVNQSMIAKIENGIKQPSLALARQIANVLECTLDDLAPSQSA